MPKKVKGEPEYSGKIGVLKLTVHTVDGEWRDWFGRMLALGEEVKRLHNRMWQRWLIWHITQGNDYRIREYMERLREWHKAEGKKPSKPKCEVQCVPKELSNAIYHDLSDFVPGLNKAPLTLAMNAMQGKMKTAPAASGSFPRWMRILAGDESTPGFQRAMPIPFSKVNSELIPPTTAGGNWQLVLRVDRIDDGSGKPAKGNRDVLTLRTGGKGGRSAVAGLWKIASGEWKFCGSNLVYRESHGKKEFAVHICYQAPKAEKADVDKDRCAIVAPAVSHPWAMIVDGRKLRLGGWNGSYIAHARRRCLTQRWSRQGAYRYAGSARKGHGRQRALKSLEKLRDLWKNFVRDCNETVTRQIVNTLKDRRCGKVVYYQPEGRFAEGRFLSTAGKVPGRHDASSWDWYQFGKRLQDKCAEAGIECEVRKHGGKAQMR